MQPPATWRDLRLPIPGREFIGKHDQDSYSDIFTINVKTISHIFFISTAAEVST
jgi:hypothetical protein